MRAMSGLRWVVPASLSAVIAVVALLSVTDTLSDEERVTGTSHDVAVAGASVCASCHLPWEAEGERLWELRVEDEGPLTGFRRLCFSCHDGTVADLGIHAFDTNLPEHFSQPGQRGQDCDRCHDPHREGYGRYIKLPGAANFCQNCHAVAGPIQHPTDVQAVPRPAGAAEWDPETDGYGIRLWDEEGTGPGSYIKCLTCHSPNRAFLESGIGAIGPQPLERRAPLCQACHFSPWGD
jgi:predicted CXXCH cytochrome family protein